MSTVIRPYVSSDLDDFIELWNSIVVSGDAFPQIVPFDRSTAQNFIASQSYVGVAEHEGAFAGLYILHPNNIGHCAHISNASYAVNEKFRGNSIGRLLVEHSLHKAKELGFEIMQFNAVVATNTSAIALYEKLGFKQIGMIPQGFKLEDGTYIDIISYYRPL